jgi:hypothetical protein
MVGWVTPVALALLGGAAPAQVLFGPAESAAFVATPAPVRFGFADVNGDGVPDLVMANGGAISWRPGDGAGHFSAGGTPVPGTTGTEILLDDLDGDGRADLIATTGSTATVQIALGEPGGFLPPVTLALGGPAGVTARVGSGDADGDGDSDLLAVLVGNATYAGQAQLFLNDGRGTLAPGPVVTGSEPNRINGGVAASLDGNAEPDLVVVTVAAGVPTSTVWLGQPGGTLSAGFSAPGLWLTDDDDIDGDGDTDLVAPTTKLLEPVLVRSYLGAGDGSFTEGPTTDLALVLFGTVSTRVAELDGDGLSDLVVVVPGTPPEAWMLHGDGRGAFVLPGSRVSLMGSASDATSAVGPLADLDVDGRLDVSATLFQFFLTSFAISLNETYPAGGPLLDLGHQLKGGGRYPIQIATGSFAGGTPFSFSLALGPGSGTVYHVVGWSVINAPFKGGTMVPMPNLLSGPWPTTSTGSLLLAGNWPMGVPSGFPIAAQFWFPSSAVAGFASSSGVRIVTP